MIGEGPGVESAGTAHSIHLLDDDSDCLLSLFEVLSHGGYHVTASSAIDDALGVVGILHPEVLIADRDIPGLSETEWVDRVTALSPATRVILTTDRSIDRASPDRPGSGGVDLLGKPVNWNLLLRAVERAVRQGGSTALSE